EDEDILRMSDPPYSTDEVSNERVRPSGVVRWIRHPENVFVLAQRKPGRLPELVIATRLAQQLEEVRAPAFLVLERQPEALHWLRGSSRSPESDVILYSTALRRAHSLSFLSRSKRSAHAAPKIVPAFCSAWSVINLCAHWR